MSQDTIVAQSTAPGKAGVAIIRLSGAAAFDAAAALVGDLPSPRQARLRQLIGAGGEVLDDGLVLCFSRPHSFTGEDVVELQLHGSPAIVAAVLGQLTGQPGVRRADPGEFTRRALENGKLDLAQVEGLADLLEAETEAQRRQAQRVLSGALGARADGWRTKLIRAAALLEATIDFADEDVPVDVTPEVTELLTEVAIDLRRELDGLPISERIRAGFEVAIVGPPNVGKSTLLNALAGRDAAITSVHAGTTRDVIEVRMDINGLPVTLLDTAGLRETTDAVEGIGITRAIERAQQADIRVFLAEAEDALPLSPDPSDLVLRPKLDTRTDGQPGVSGKTGEGIPELVECIGGILAERAAQSSLSIRARHGSAIRSALDGLETAISGLVRGPESYDLVADDLRAAIRSLESLVGRIDVENLLDEIFASFCLGK